MDVSSPYLEIRDSPGRGRGVFAATAIPSRAVITVSPILRFSHEEYAAHGQHTALAHYAFVWRDQQPPSMALALGLGSIFNHAREPSAGWECDIEGQVIRYISLRAISKGEEVFISYGPSLWFKDEGEGSEAEGEAEEKEDPAAFLGALSPA